MENEHDTDTNSIIQSSYGSSNSLLSKKDNFFKRTKQSAREKLTTSCIFFLLAAVFIVVTGLPVSQVIIGSLYKNSCPIHPYIPLYLIIAGVSTLLLLFISIMKIIIENSCFCSFLHIIITIFCFAWFITGNVWTFRAKKTVQYDYPDDPSTYCDYSVFTCAYGTIFISYGFLVGTICFSTKRST